ncbi:Ig-like domain-containing protein, partial [Limnohabitans sp. Rim8]|uniref:Ig-like domain-containing protein n=1 Tax=Limnohabitans sp. Rim8 TaxID=1100718 RepID=UPI0025FB3C72
LNDEVTYDKLAIFIDWNNGYTYDNQAVGTPPSTSVTYYVDDVSFVGELPDTTSPTVTSFSPLDDATGVSASANIVLNFSELVVAREGGTIQLMTDYNFNHQMIEEIAVNDTSKVQINGNVVTINPSADFQTGTGYHLGFVDAFADTSANAFSYPHGNYNFTVL